MEDRILVVDDEQDFLDSIRRGLITYGFKNVSLERDPMRAAADIQNGRTFDIALIDMTMPGMNGTDLLELIKNTTPDTECLMVTAVNDARVAVECLRKGAYDYLVKPVTKEDLMITINRALERKRLLNIISLGKRKSPPQLVHKEAFHPILTRSLPVLKILKEAELHAESDVPVLITGESGTGKELLARAIHLASTRASFPFTPVNMASLAANLFDAEFFGHTKGAFTGAERDRVGYLEYTNRGTLFLDEVGILPFELQGKLLRVLQEKEFYKIGTSRPQRADVRFIAATNADLDSQLAKGAFRKDLYYRLKGAWLHLPSLKERREDIPLLIHHFLEEFCPAQEGRQVEADALSVLMDYDYPGNIRELRSIIQSAVNLAQGRPIALSALSSPLRNRKPAAKGSRPRESGPTLPLAEVEKTHILKVYEQTGNNKVQTAQLLAIGLNTLRRKLNSYGIH